MRSRYRMRSHGLKNGNRYCCTTNQQDAMSGQFPAARWKISCDFVNHIFDGDGSNQQKESRMFTDKIELKDIDKMDPEYKELLGHGLTIQADCEIGGAPPVFEKKRPGGP